MKLLLITLILTFNVAYGDTTVPSATVIKDFKPIGTIKTITEILK